MLRVSNPFVAIRRLWYTGGNGIHSPFAYQMVTQVINCPGNYYADRNLYSLSDRILRPRMTAVRRLMFRLTNYWQPTTVEAPVEYHTYIASACKRTRIMPSDKAYISMDSDKGLLMVLPELQKYKDLWNEWKKRDEVRVTFDLYDVGIAISLPRLNKQDYVINW